MTKRRVSFWWGILLLLLLSIAGWFLFRTWLQMPSIRSVSAGESHSLVLLADGSVWGWGGNLEGQLGSGEWSSVTPVQIQGLHNICAIDAGANHAVALDSSGVVWTWGTYGTYAIYRPDRVDYIVTSFVGPSIVPTLANVRMVSAGYHYSLALDALGLVWAWGGNDYGQLGNGTNDSAETPARVEGLEDVVDISAGAFHGLAVYRDGTVWGWGDNVMNQLGPELPSKVLIPTRIEGLRNITDVSAGYSHSVALAEDGHVWVWGLVEQHYELTSFEFGDRVISIDTESGHSTTLVLLENGQVWAWGSNRVGELGNNTQTPSYEPIQVMGLPDIMLIAAGGSHNIVVDESGSLWGWGLDDDMQLGRSSFFEWPYRNPESTDYVLKPRKILNTIAMTGPEISCP